MQKQKNIQQALRKAFPEFNDKKRLIDYYVSFDFPDKQMRMVGWWQRVLQFIIQQENRAYVTYQELVSFLTIEHLKPTPLQSIIKHLAKKNLIVPQNQYEIKEAIKQSNIQTKKTFFDSLLSYVYKPAIKEQSPFKFIPTQKIYSKKIKEFKKSQIKKILPTIFTQHVKSINLYKLIQQLQDEVNLDRDSLFQLFNELHEDKIIYLCQNSHQEFVLYSNNSADFENKEWVELEGMKFCLREQIQIFQFKMSQEEEKVSKLKEKAKQQIANKQTKAAHATCREITQKKKKLENINTRKNILQNQITQLQYNEMNKNTMTLLEEAHAIYEQTMIDQNKLDQIAQKNMEIEVANKQTNEKIESLANREDIDDDVDEMMRSLERQIMKQPQKKLVKVEIPMEIEHKKQQPQKQKIKVEVPMDIEDKTKQQPKQKMDIEGYKA